MRRLPRPLICTLVLLALPAGAAELRVEDAWIKHLPASVPMRAGYATLFNPTSRSVKIVAAHGDGFASVEFHQSTMQDGMMRMQQLPLLEIDAGSSLRLEPGGIHLMLMQPAEPGAPGETRRITFEYDDGTAQQLVLEIRK